MTWDKAKKFFEVTGVVFPFLVFLAVTIFSFSIPGYNFIDGYVSFLGSIGSPFRYVVNIFGFGLFGVIAMGLGYFFFDTFKTYYGRIASRLFMGTGLLIFLLAFFPSDPTFYDSTTTGRLHSMIGNLAFVMWPIATLAFGFAFRKEQNWGRFWAVTSFILAGLALFASGILKFFPVLDGLVERIGIGADLLWIMFVSLNLLFEDKQVSIKKFFDKLNLNINI